MTFLYLMSFFSDNIIKRLTFWKPFWNNKQEFHSKHFKEEKYQAKHINNYFYILKVLTGAYKINWSYHNKYKT